MTHKKTSYNLKFFNIKEQYRLYLKELTMKYLLILILAMNAFLFAGGGFSSKDITHYKQMDKVYDVPQIITKDKCETCGEPAELLPYKGEDIPLAQTFPCTEIKGCL